MLVVCEGSVTEPEYLQGFAKACRNPRVRIQIRGGEGAPKTLVENAKELRRAAERRSRRERDDNLRFDAVWCVFDVDEHPSLPLALQMAHDSGIELAVSNPCVELWLLLHFRESPGMRSQHDVHKMLKSHLNGYDKHVTYSAFAPGYEAAVTRARRLDAAAEAAGENGRNPTTGVWRLTESIRETS